MRTLSGDPEQWRHLLLYSVETQVAQVSAESARRTELVQAKKQQDAAAENMDRTAWLESLQLTLQVETMTDGAHPRYVRALELLNKTNQFNTTGQRWTDAELQNWLAAGGVLLAVSAQDRFAPHGLIALALLQMGMKNIRVILPPLAAMMPAGIFGMIRALAGTRNRIYGVEAPRQNGQPGFFWGSLLNSFCECTVLVMYVHGLEAL
ncbi:hypothetical protein [Acidithiobacillus concretivorus]|uniref:Uncharacterized protein n=1 Tax=Acidithiobacillus concretivorus TaxID=3063952 RepID=A0ABS5ZL56_9PROT|nr:hypothetical protein [Acidithiobacillus concretivorus]MBU2737421.1 hypothetical protein [Acidithiobacillus concretivorus]